MESDQFQKRNMFNFDIYEQYFISWEKMQIFMLSYIVGYRVWLQQTFNTNPTMHFEIYQQ